MDDGLMHTLPPEVTVVDVDFPVEGPDNLKDYITFMWNPKPSDLICPELIEILEREGRVVQPLVNGPVRAVPDYAEVMSDMDSYRVMQPFFVTDREILSDGEKNWWEKTVLDYYEGLENDVWN